MNYMERAFAPAEAHYKNLMNIQTWGHLFPTKKKYIGNVRIARSLYGSQGTVILDEDKNLPQSSPWWFDAINDFLCQVDDNMEAGEVAQFTIRVDIVHCVEELDEDEQAEYDADPWELKTWEEIHIKQLSKTILVKAW